MAQRGQGTYLGPHSEDEPGRGFTHISGQAGAWLGSSPFSGHLFLAEAALMGLPPPPEASVADKGPGALPTAVT